ncbi:MAG: hypothetical protein NT014_07795, partial [Candidatus Omnitrophica bacterium]|nr:hypothetical protein [Candidatus Omnitrophota bacterium]
DLVDPLFNGFDIVTGSRYAKGARIERKIFRFYISIIYNALIRLLFRTRIRDHMCGFKAFKKDVALKLVEEMGYDTSLRRGIFWDTELLVRAIRNNYKIKEIPIWWKERNKSALYFKREIGTLAYILSFWWKFTFVNKPKAG